MKSIRVPILGVQLRIMGGDMSSLDFYPELRGRLIRGPNSQIASHRKRVLDLGKLFDGFFKHELVDGPNGILLSRRVVTDAGVAFLVNDWFDGSKDITNFNAHGNGQSTSAESTTQTGLISELGTRQVGTKSKPAANQVRSVATIPQVATAAITEHGLFDSVTPAGSTLWDRSMFGAINVANGDSIEFTYTLSVNSGG